MTLTWHTGSVDLAAGYFLIHPEGHQITGAESARFAIEGGFVHIELPGSDTVQVVSAPAVLRIAYRDAGPG